MSFDEQPDGCPDCATLTGALAAEKERADKADRKWAIMKGTWEGSPPDGIGAVAKAVERAEVAEERIRVLEGRLDEVTSTIEAIPFGERKYPTRQDMRVEIASLSKRLNEVCEVLKDMRRLTSTGYPIDVAISDALSKLSQEKSKHEWHCDAVGPKKCDCGASAPDKDCDR